jgi:hypothetical protein
MKDEPKSTDKDLEYLNKNLAPKLTDILNQLAEEDEKKYPLPYIDEDDNVYV